MVGNDPQCDINPCQCDRTSYVSTAGLGAASGSVNSITRSLTLHIPITLFYKLDAVKSAVGDYSGRGCLAPHPGPFSWII